MNPKETLNEPWQKPYESVYSERAAGNNTIYIHIYVCDHVLYIKYILNINIYIYMLYNYI